MKMCIQHAFDQQLLNLEGAFKEAVEQACAPERIQHLLNEAADKHIQEVIKEEVRSFFYNGEGRKAVKAAVEKRLSDDLGVF